MFTPLLSEHFDVRVAFVQTDDKKDDKEKETRLPGVKTLRLHITESETRNTRIGHTCRTDENEIIPKFKIQNPLIAGRVL